MKICLINPPLIFKMKKNEEWSNYSLHNFQQLGLGYIAASLEQCGYKVDIIDCPCQRINNNEAIEKVLENQYDFVGISIFSYNFMNAKRIISKIRIQNKKIFIAAGGYIPTLNYKDTLYNNPELNCCFIGEGEKSLISFCDAYSIGLNWKKIENIAYIENGKVIVNTVKHSVRNLDALPFPVRVNKNNYSNTLSILTSRGCYGNCSFCSERSFNTINNSLAMRFRSPENVVEEINQLVMRYKPMYININDSNFLEATITRKKWLKQFIILIKKQNIHVKFRINTRANDILGNQELLPELVNIGISSVFLGIESFNQRQLDLYNKKITVKHNIEAIKVLQSLDIKLEMGLMIFEPFAELREIEESLAILKELKIIKFLDYNQYFFSSGCKLFAIKGTPIYEYIEKKDMAQDNELGYQFAYSDVQKYYNLVKRWCDTILPYNEYKYLIDKSLVVENGKWHTHMLEWFENIMEFDLQTVIELASYICKNEREVEYYFAKRSRQLYLLNDKYQEAIRELN